MKGDFHSCNFGATLIATIVTAPVLAFAQSGGGRTPRDIDLATLALPRRRACTTWATRLRCGKCKRAGKRPVATPLQIAPKARHVSTEL